MSLTGALNAALSGIKVSTTAVQVISSNVSNAQTTGYTDKSLSLSESVVGTSYGGVEISSYNRVSDSVLSATLNSATTTSSYYSTQDSFLTQIQNILDSSASPPALASAVSNFQSAWTAYSASSNSSADEANVISTGEQLATTINSIASQISSLKTNVESDLSTSVSTLNTDLQQVQTLNTQIQSAIASNQSPSDLEDQRDTLINNISALTNVQVMTRSDGTVALYTSNGTALLDGTAQTFSVSNDQVVNALGANVSSALGGGTLQAQTDFLSTDTSNTGNGVAVISKLTAQLQSFASQFTSTSSASSFASTYDSATTDSGELASSFFTYSTDGNGNIDLTSFAVNSALVNGTSTVKAAAATSVANSFTATNSYTSGGLTVTNQTYAGIANSILSYFQQAANSVAASSTTASAQQSYYQSALSKETGVNTDTELVNLTSWQNAYAASAHVISTIEAMFTTLENMIS